MANVIKQQPFECDIEFSFGSVESAKMARQALEVDAEIQPDKITKSFTLDANVMKVHFSATEPRLLRAAVSSFYDLALVVTKTLLAFDK